MKRSIYLSEQTLNMNERLFRNALDGVTDDQAKERISDHNNPLIWITTHTVWARYKMLILMGQPVPNPFEDMFENFKAYDPAESYPTLETIKAEWTKVSKLLNDALQTVTEEYLAQDSPLKSPIGDFTNGGTLAFLVQHESYDIGQMAFLKKYFTELAMKY